MLAEFDSHSSVHRSHIFKQGKGEILCLFNLDTMANSVLLVPNTVDGGDRHRRIQNSIVADYL